MYPKTIDNGHGERLTFVGRDGDRLLVDGTTEPGAGPPMHVHWLQTETLRVESGRIGYAIAGESDRFAGPGEIVSFGPGVEHRFWNAGEDELVCDGWVGPPDNLEYFLTKMFASMEATGGKRPRMYDTAFLLTRYRSEFGMTEIPQPVQTLLFPVLLAVGRVLGWHKRFGDAPAPLPAS